LDLISFEFYKLESKKVEIFWSISWIEDPEKDESKLLLRSPFYPGALILKSSYIS